MMTMAWLMPVNAQSKYETCYSNDSLIISGKWVNSNTFDQESPLELRLKIENRGKKLKELSFEILLYMDKVLKEKSEKIEISIKPGKVKQGKINGVRFLPTILTNDEISGKRFSWEISVDKPS